MRMRFEATVLFAALAMSTAPRPVIAQTRVSSGSHPQQPAAAPQGGPSQPSPRPATQPFRTTMIGPPMPVPAHRAFPVRLPWFGFVLFDPYWWTPSGFDQTSLPPTPLSANDSRPMGGLQIDVEPRRALVYVDGWFVGVVDSFKGYFQHLDLAAGSHQIELLDTDYEPLRVEVMVSPGRTTTYRGWLNRAPGR